MASFNCEATDASCPHLYEPTLPLCCKAPFYSADADGFVHIFNEKKTLREAVSHCEGERLQFYSLDKEAKRKEAENWMRYLCGNDGALIDRLSHTYHGGLRTLDGVGKWLSGELFLSKNHSEWFRNGLSPSEGCQVCYFHASDDTPLGEGSVQYACGGCDEKHSFFCVDSPTRHVDEQQVLLLPTGAQDSFDSEAVCDNLLEKALYFITPSLLLLLIVALIYVILERKHNLEKLRNENDNQEIQGNDNELFEQGIQSEMVEDDIVQECVDGEPSGENSNKILNCDDQRKVSEV